jgi:hypothetical protein
MARAKTIGQARELARQSANFYGVAYAAYIDAADEIHVAPADAIRGDQQFKHREDYHPAEERPNELDRRELAAVRAWLLWLSLSQKPGAVLPPYPVQRVFSGNGKHNPLAAAELERLQDRLMATRK